MIEIHLKLKIGSQKHSVALSKTEQKLDTYKFRNTQDTRRKQYELNIRNNKEM